MGFIYCLKAEGAIQRFDTSHERQIAWSAAYLQGQVTCEWVELTGDDRRKVEVINGFGHVIEWLYDNTYGIQADIRADIPNAVAYRFLDVARGGWLIMQDA